MISINISWSYNFISPFTSILEVQLSLISDTSGFDQDSKGWQWHVSNDYRAVTYAAPHNWKMDVTKG